MQTKEGGNKQREKGRVRFMAPFDCGVLLDLAQCVWAELHFANYFPVAVFSAWRSFLALRGAAQRRVLSQPYSGCEIVLGPWWTVGEAEQHGTEAITR